MKRIVVTENQAKMIVDYIIGQEMTISEQANFGTNTETKESKVYNISNSFASGQYKLTNTKDIIAAMQAINKEIAGYPANQKFMINVVSSESAVPPPAGMAVGDLSRLRGEAVEDFLRKGKYITDDIQVKKIDKGVQGPAWDVNKGKNDPEYKKNQYVTLSLQVIGSKVSSVICDFNENVNGGVAQPENDFISYNKTIDISGLPNGTKFKIAFSPLQMADMMIVTAGSDRRSTGFVSSAPGSPMIKAALATALWYGYDGQVPDYFQGASAIRELSKQEKQEIFGMISMSAIQAMLGHVMKKVDWNWPEAFLSNNRLYTFAANVIRTTRKDDPDIQTLTPEGDGQASVMIFTKDQSMSSVTITVYSPVGGTKWSLGAKCL
ncbi:MAG: hypothetical protein RLZ10_2690 [Bacteroidota bacterium]|jgi:hypothetical protein